jgi:hypothetical protein
MKEKSYCFSKGKACPITAKAKCLLWTGARNHGSEAFAPVARDGFGRDRKDHLEGGEGKDR